MPAQHTHPDSRTGSEKHIKAGNTTGEGEKPKRLRQGVKKFKSKILRREIIQERLKNQINHSKGFSEEFSSSTRCIVTNLLTRLLAHSVALRHAQNIKSAHSFLQEAVNTQISSAGRKNSAVHRIRPYNSVPQAFCAGQFVEGRICFRSPLHNGNSIALLCQLKPHCLSGNHVTEPIEQYCFDFLTLFFHLPFSFLHSVLFTLIVYCFKIA